MSHKYPHKLILWMKSLPYLKIFLNESKAVHKAYFEQNTKVNCSSRLLFFNMHISCNVSHMHTKPFIQHACEMSSYRNNRNLIKRTCKVIPLSEKAEVITAVESGQSNCSLTKRLRRERMQISNSIHQKDAIKRSFTYAGTKYLIPWTMPKNSINWHM